MRLSEGRNLGHIETIGSAIIHTVPGLKFLHRIAAGLPEDMVQLQWRLEKRTLDHDFANRFVRIPASSNEGPRDLQIGTYSGAVISTSTKAAQLVTDRYEHRPRRLAVAYLLEPGHNVMVGVNNQREGLEISFLRQLADDPGRMGIIVGIGEHPGRFRLGSADENGRNFEMLDTEYHPDIVPETSGLLRV